MKRPSKQDSGFTSERMYSLSEWIPAPRSMFLMVCLLLGDWSKLASIPVEAKDEAAVGQSKAIGSQIATEISTELRKKYQITEPCSSRWLEVLTSCGDDAMGAARAIVNEKCRVLLPQVEALTKHSHPSVRQSAAEILGALGDASVAPSLRNMLGDMNDSVALAALDGYCQLAPGEGRELIPVLRLESSSWRIRRDAVALGHRLGVPLSPGDTIKILDDDLSVGEELLTVLPCELLRYESVRNRISELAGDVLLPELMYTQEQRDRGYAAIDVIYRCELKSACGVLQSVLSGVQRYHLEDEGTSRLIRAVGNCQDGASRNAIEEFASTHESSPKLADWPASNISTPLETAIEVLKEIGGQSSKPALARALNDPYYRVRLMALSTIEKLGLGCSFKEKLQSIRTTDKSEEVVREASRLSLSVAKNCSE